MAEHAKVEEGLKPSSIRPFQIGSLLTKNKGWKVTLYEKPGLNKGFSTDVKQTTFILSDYFSCQEFKLDWPPQSIEIKGDLVAVLTESTGESEIFKKTKEGLAESAATKLTVISGRVIGKLN